MSKIVLYWHPMSSATPVACALAELGVAHERVKVDITAGEQRQPGFLALNPNGKVPTLTVDGAPMFETVAIEMWLGETYGVEKGLWPAEGTPERLQAMAWSTWSYVTYGAQLVRSWCACRPRATWASPTMRTARRATKAWTICWHCSTPAWPGSPGCWARRIRWWT